MSQSSPTDFEAGHLLPSADDTMLNTGAFGDDADCMQLHFEPHKTSKKMTQAASGLCCVCGATETPQWRSGPRGLNTLCNGCGIRWRKGRLVIDGESNTSAKAAQAPKKKPEKDAAARARRPSDGLAAVAQLTHQFFRQQQQLQQLHHQQRSTQARAGGKSPSDGSVGFAGPLGIADDSCDSSDDAGSDRKRRREAREDDSVVSDSDDDEKLYAKRYHSQHSHAEAAAEHAVGTRVVVTAADANNEKPGTVIGYKRNGWYQIALDESPLAPVRYRTVSFKVTGFCDAPQLSAAARSGPAVEAARPSAQPSARPTTDATVASGTLIQHRRSREMGTVVGYRGNGWYHAMMQGDDEAVLLKRTAFALVGDADAAEPEVEEPMRAGSGGSGARSHIEVASMEGAAEIGRWSVVDLQMLRHELRTCLKAAQERKVFFVGEIDELDAQTNTVVSNRWRRTQAKRANVLSAAATLLGPTRAASIRTSWNRPWAIDESDALCLGEGTDPAFAVPSVVAERMFRRTQPCSKVGVCARHGRRHTYESSSDESSSDNEDGGFGGFGFADGAAGSSNSGDDLSDDEGVAEIAPSDDETMVAPQHTHAQAHSGDRRRPAYGALPSEMPSEAAGITCGSIGTRRNRPCQRVGFCPYHGGTAGSRVPAAPDGTVHASAAGAGPDRVTATPSAMSDVEEDLADADGEADVLNTPMDSTPPGGVCNGGFDVEGSDGSRDPQSDAQPDLKRLLGFVFGGSALSAEASPMPSPMRLICATAVVTV